MKAFLALFALLCMTCKPLYASATNIYVAQFAAGVGNGADCADAYPVAWFNNAANWGTGAGLIGPGTTVHLCGTFTGTNGSTMLTPQGSGASGNPVTILFEPNAQLLAPYWGDGANSAGAITIINGRNYITVDGGSNGLIACTDNGTALDYHQTSVGVQINGVTTSITVRALLIKDIYVNGGFSTNCVDIAGQNTEDIGVGSSYGARISSNVLRDARYGIGCGGTIDRLELDHNTISNHCFGIVVQTDANTVTTNCAIHDNEITGWTSWQYPGGNHPPDVYHTDGIFLSTWAGTGLFAPQVYNNYIHGNLGGGSATAFIYLTTAGSPPTPTSGIVYNNLLVCTGASFWGIGIAVGTTNNQVYNNTIIGAYNNSYPIIASGDNSTILNNLAETYQTAIGSYTLLTNSTTVCDYNVYYNIGNINVSGPGAAFNNDFVGNVEYSWQQWQNAGHDPHSTTNNPNLNANYYPQTPSAAIGAGTNLTSLGITALDSDKAGTSRPSSGAWGIGAYQLGMPGIRSGIPSGMRLFSTQ